MGFRRLRGLANQLDEQVERRPSILSLRPELTGMKDQDSFLGDPITRCVQQPVSDIVGQGRRMGHIKTELYCRGDLIDVLSARARGPDKIFVNLTFVNRERGCNLNHGAPHTDDGRLGNAPRYLGIGACF